MSTKIYIGNLPPGIPEYELEREFGRFGPMRSVWVARKPPGFGFVEFEDPRDAADAVRALDGFQAWRVEFSRGPGGGGGPPRGRGPSEDPYGPLPPPGYRRSPPAPRRRSPSPPRYHSGHGGRPQYSPVHPYHRSRSRDRYRRGYERGRSRSRSRDRRHNRSVMIH